MITFHSAQNRLDTSLFQPRSAPQNIARTYYQKAMEAQARQQSEILAQLLMQQLKQLLAKRLEEHPSVTGKCVVAEHATNLSA